jgi:hypothetical protein
LQQGYGLLEEAWLRVVRVDFKKLCHGVAYWMRAASNSHTGVKPPGR